jgi:hypothetical protein
MEMSYDDAYALFEAKAPVPGTVTRIAPPTNLPGPVLSRGSGFFRPDATSNAPGEINLRRGLKNNAEIFYLDTPIGYLDKEFGVFLIPFDGPVKSFDTDLASVPQLFTWIVPKTGTHLQAALLHDGFTPPADHTYFGPAVTQQQADRMFRDAMDSLGTGTVRQWLVWTAVAIATDVKSIWSSPALSIPCRIGKAARHALLAIVILLLGTMATLDLFDAANILPWMGTRSTAYELTTGALVALIVPAVLALPFLKGGLYTAAYLLGIAIALFLHATLITVFLLLAYNLLEAVVEARRRRKPGLDILKQAAALASYVIFLTCFVKLALADVFRLGRWGRAQPYDPTSDVVGGIASAVWNLPWWVFAAGLIGAALLFLLATQASSRNLRTTR